MRKVARANWRIDRKSAEPQMSRRSAIAALSAFVPAIAAGVGPARGAAGAERPNILWLVSEDNNPFIGAYGNSLARTPVIDRLARSGVLFRNAYSNAPVCAPSRFAILTGIHPESCAPANQMRATAKLPAGFRTYPELLRSAGYFCTNNAKTDYNCDVDPAKIWDRQGASAHWRDRPVGAPFMAVFNYETTHESRIFRPTDGRVSPDMVSIPPYLPDTPGIRRDRASYYNLIEKMDGQLAKALEELADDGLAEDTIVFYYSDNGGVLGRSKRYCHDEGLRCALVIYAPPKWRHLLPVPHGGEVASPVSLIDLAPTVLALAGVKQPPQMHGKPLLGPQARRSRYAFGMRNRMDERIDFQRTVTDGRWRYIRNYMPHRPLGQHQAFEWLAKGYQEWEAAHLAGTLNPVQDQFFQPKPFEQLFDLQNDPHQIDNLAQSPALGGKMREMSRALDRHMLAINDNGFIPETMAGEGYFESRDERVYPFKAVMRLAGIAARGAPAGLPVLEASLGSPHPVMRYWACTGLLILGAQAAPALRRLALVMANDPSPQVKVVAAEIVAKLGKENDAVPVLMQLSDHAAEWQVRLHALNALTCLGPLARPALATAQRAAQSDNEYLRSAGRYLVAQMQGTYTPTMPIFDFELLMAKARAGSV